MELTQYSIVLVNLDPTIGSEIQKTRPCVIISPVEMNENLNTIVLAPMTSQFRNYPTRVTVRFNGKNGKIALDQIRTVDKSRIIKIYKPLSQAEIKRCKTVLKETYVD